MAEEGVSVPEIPWVIAFDAEHTELHWEFIAGVRDGLKNLMRSVVVIAVRPSRISRSDSRVKALRHKPDPWRGRQHTAKLNHP